MKNSLLILLICFPIFTFSQNGQIISITTNPVNPTTADFVEVYVELMFNSGGCDLDNQAHNTSGNNTTASAHHCVGMLTVICSVTDTFDLGYLQAGTHQFDFVLSSGSGGPGCTPGIIPDDSDSHSFSVTSPLGVEEDSKPHNFTLYPNPTNDWSYLKISPELAGKNLLIEITDISGRLIFSANTNGASGFSLAGNDFPDGMYQVFLSEKDEIISSEKWIKY